METIEFVNDVPSNGQCKAWILLSHGAGAPMTSPFMNEIAALIAVRGIGVSRLEFSYMAERRITGKRRPPPKAERLTTEFVAAVETLRNDPQRTGLPLLIGGKSMGGRVATLAADTLFAEGKITGAVALGYPFHPPGKPQSLRTAHLEDLKAPLLIVQGERDSLGSRPQIMNYSLSPSVQIAWATDGDHDLAPRKSSGTTHQSNLAAAADAIAGFVERLAP